jgi:hypothetical protein
VSACEVRGDGVLGIPLSFQVIEINLPFAIISAEISSIFAALYELQIKGR